MNWGPAWLKSGSRQGLVTKFIGKEPREGYGNPAVIPLEHGILNAAGLANPGIEKYEDEIKDAKRWSA